MSIIDIKDTSVYQKEIMVLSDVNIQINKGDFVYLKGRTGSGKSSLLKLLYADLPLVKGSVKINDYDLSKIKRKKVPYLRRSLGIVFQDFQLLYDRTVFDNLKFIAKATAWKDKDKINDRIAKVLDDVGLGTKGYKMPHQLSGGEQQRLGIARALFNDPAIILADEPTGNLDPETSIGILELLFELSKRGKTVVIATHDYSLVDKFPGRKLIFEAGKVTEEFDTEKLNYIEEEIERREKEGDENLLADNETADN
jgi:cell division transport system ATP-binding protein